MLSTIESVNNVVNNFIWGVPAMICIIGVGLLLSVRTGFIQIRKFPYAMKVTIGRMLRKKDATDGAMTPFQAVCTALAATVGTGNIAGVAGAIAIGGPGAVGSFFISMKKGVSRGIFSNEAGLGTGSIAHACADTDEPVKQGMFGIFEVFADTIEICTLTALVILCGGEGIQYGVAAGAELTISGFVTTYGSWVTIFTAIAMCCFAFSTILGWGLYGARCVEFVFTTKVVKPFMIVYALVAILGATVDLGIIWGIADTCNGLMSIPNLIALFLLSGTVAKLVKDYFAKQEKKN